MVILLASAAIATLPIAVAAFVRDHRLTRYAVALPDLNRDGKPEALLYAMDDGSGSGSALCGSGGCNLYVLSLTRGSYRVVTDISITRPPIRVLPSLTHGWHDLSVWVAGGGILPGYQARLPFNGRTYPNNPTMSPATPIEGGSGKVVIGALPAPNSRQ